jgi:ankyrin repeat protein
MRTNNSHNHIHNVYTRDDDLPFRPDGNDAIISGSVEKVKRTSGSDKGLLYARKTIIVDERGDPEGTKRKFLEAKILLHARHGHVVKLVETYFFLREQDTRFAIVMERADTNLDTYLKGWPSSRIISQMSRWFGCLIGVTAYIHGFGIRHRDIKPSNILIKDRRVLLADFGISKMGLGKSMPTTIPALARSRTTAYCAPEVEDGSTRGRSADIFSLGAVFLEMLIAHSYNSERKILDEKLMFQGDRSYAKSLDHVHGFMDRIERELQLDAWFLKVLSYCRKMLHVDRDQRPLADELHSAWLSLQPSDQPLAPCTCPEALCASDNMLVGLCKNGSLEQVEILLFSGEDPNTLGAIHQASTRGYGKIVDCFLEHGTDPNLRDYSGQTSLHCATGYGHKDIVQMLLEREVDVQAKDEEGQTALHCAAGQGQKCIVEMLLDKRADIQATDGEGQTALHMAAKRGHDDVVKTLLERGANAEIMDAQGRTALHFAAGSGREKVVEMVLNVVSNDTVYLQDKTGETALHFATRGKQPGGKYEEVRKMLKAKGADLTLTENKGMSRIKAR